MSSIQDWDHFISLQQAKAMTALYRTQKENILAPQYQGRNILCLSETFNRDAFDQVLAQIDCVGIRIYFGMNPDLTIRTIVVGVNANNGDMIPVGVVGAAAAPGDDGGKIVEVGRPCPDFCASDPSLNNP
jgi:hypothetical protein